MPGEKNPKKAAKKPRKKKTQQRGLSEKAILQASKAIRTAADAIHQLLGAVPAENPATVPPGENMPAEQFPSVEQVAQLAALIGQGQPKELEPLIAVLPIDPSADINEASRQSGYGAANRLANAAMMLWRAANDQRALWLLEQQGQGREMNYEAAKRCIIYKPEDSTAKFHVILTKLHVPRKEQDKHIWPWEEAKDLIFKSDDVEERERLLVDLIKQELIGKGGQYDSWKVKRFQQVGIPWDGFERLVLASEEHRIQHQRDLGARGGKKSAEKRQQQAMAKKKARGRSS